MFRNERFINLYYLGYVMRQDVPIRKDVSKTTEVALLVEIREKVDLLISDADAVSKKLKFQEENKNEKNKR